MKTVIIGAGMMGRRHMQAARDLGLEIVGIADLSPQALAAAEAEQGIPAEHHFQDPDSLFAVTEPECVIIATTAPSHMPLTLQAVGAGAKFILCEKPMATSLADCQTMMDACEAAGVRLGINHQTRFMDRYREPLRLMQGEDFGAFASMTIVGGNMGMAMNASHKLEIFHHLTGESAAQVSAWFADSALPNPRGAQFEDKAGALRVVTPSGKRLYMDIGDDQGHGLQVIYSGTYGQIIVDELAGRMAVTMRESQHRSQPTTRYGMPAQRYETDIAPAEAVAPTRDMLKALFAGEGYTSGQDAYRALQTLVAAYQSHENGGCPISVDHLALERQFPWA